MGERSRTLPLRLLDETDDVAVGVLRHRGELATAHILDCLLHLRAGVEDRLQALLDVVDVPIGDGPRGPLVVAVRVETDLLVADLEPDVVRLIA